MTASRHIEATTLLSECELFAGAGPDDFRALAAVATHTTWHAGMTIFQQGSPGDFLIIVQSGRLRLSLTTSSGRELAIRHAQRGAAVGEMSVLDHQSRSADATAVTASEGLLIRRGPFERVLTERPGLAQALIRYLSHRLRETTYQLESVALYELSARLARFLLAALRQSHGPSLQPMALLSLDLGQSEIAAILGASRPKVNRALAELAERGAIRRNGKALECSIAQLNLIAEADGS